MRTAADKEANKQNENLTDKSYKKEIKDDRGPSEKDAERDGDGEVLSINPLTNTWNSCTIDSSSSPHSAVEKERVFRQTPYPGKLS